MAGATGHHSYGTKLYYAAFDTVEPGSGVDPLTLGYALLGEVISINGLPMNSSVTKLTHLNSDEKAHEKIPGFLDAGQITFRMNNAEALVLTLQSLVPDQTDTAPGWGRLQFVVEFPDGSQWYSTAFVQGLPFEVPEDDRNTVECTLEVSGRPHFS